MPFDCCKNRFPYYCRQAVSLFLMDDIELIPPFILSWVLPWMKGSPEYTRVLSLQNCSRKNVHLKPRFWDNYLLFSTGCQIHVQRSQASIAQRQLVYIGFHHHAYRQNQSLPCSVTQF